jgi:hypothetical protein
MHPSTVQAAYFDILAAGEYLGIVKEVRGDTDPVRTQKNQLQRMYWLVRSKQIPYIKRGTRIFFEKAELDTWMRSGAHHQWHQSTSQPV